MLSAPKPSSAADGLRARHFSEEYYSPPTSPTESMSTPPESPTADSDLDVESTTAGGIAFERFGSAQLLIVFANAPLRNRRVCKLWRELIDGHVGHVHAARTAGQVATLDMSRIVTFLAGQRADGALRFPSLRTVFLGGEGVCSLDRRALQAVLANCTLEELTINTVRLPIKSLRGGEGCTLDHIKLVGMTLQVSLSQATCPVLASPTHPPTTATTATTAPTKHTARPTAGDAPETKGEPQLAVRAAALVGALPVVGPCYRPMPSALVSPDER